MNDLGRFLRFAVHGEFIRRRARRRRAPRGPRRDWRYRAFIRTKPCACGCGRRPCRAAHTGKDGGTAQKSDDWSRIPLFWRCHWEFDNGLRSGALFLLDHGIDLPELVRSLNEEFELAERGRRRR